MKVRGDNLSLASNLWDIGRCLIRVFTAWLRNDILEIGKKNIHAHTTSLNWKLTRSLDESRQVYSGVVLDCIDF